MAIELRPAVMFGLLDRWTYSDYDGHTGDSTYDDRAGVITMTDGSRRGSATPGSRAVFDRCLTSRFLP